MSPWHLLALWDFGWAEMAGLALLTGAYLALCRFQLQRRAWYFAGALLVLALCVFSPIDVLADHYLFSAHMLEHIGIALVAPPLVLLSLPPERMRPLLAAPLLRPLAWLLSRPLGCWGVGVLVMWLWHIPRLYDAAVLSEPLHGLEHVFFFVSGLIFYGPVAASVPEARLAPAAGMIYLFGGATALGLLGILITFARPGLYAVYTNPADPYGVLALIRQRLDISAAFDQQLGGLAMWVVGGGVLLGSLLLIFVRYLRGEQVGEDELISRRP